MNQPRFLKFLLIILSFAVLGASFALLYGSEEKKDEKIVSNKPVVPAIQEKKEEVLKPAAPKPKAKQEIVKKQSAQIVVPPTVQKVSVSSIVEKQAEEASIAFDTEENTQKEAQKREENRKLRAIYHTVIAEITNREQGALNAELQFDSETGWFVTDDREGRYVENKSEVAEGISREILKNDGDPKDPKNYFGIFKSIPADIQKKDLSDMLIHAQELSKENIEIKMGDYSIGHIELASQADKWYIPDYKKRVLLINSKMVEDAAADFVSRNSKEAGHILVKGMNEFTSEYNYRTYKKAIVDGNAETGWTVNAEKLRSDLYNALTNSEERIISTEIDKIPVRISSTIPGMEFPDLIAEGFSDYSQSNGPDRVHNLQTGIDAVSMVVVDPGESFSINEALGWVTYDKGYKDALVLFGTGVGEAPGGGLCQISTTLYRAALFAGFPVTERKPHSWDVSYYRDLYGLDAATFPPNDVDLRFVNDSPGPIMILGYLNRERDMAHFDFYGTDDGREVEINFIDKVWTGGKSKRVRNEWIIRRPGGEVESQIISSWYRQ